MSNIHKLYKSKLFNIIEEEIEAFFLEGKEEEIKAVALKLIKNDPSLSKEEAHTIAKSIIFRKNQPRTLDYSQKTGEASEDTPYLNLIRGPLREVDPKETTPEGVSTVVRGKTPTQKQSALDRGSAAMVNDLLKKVELLEHIMRRDSQKFMNIEKRLNALEGRQE